MTPFTRLIQKTLIKGASRSSSVSSQHKYTVTGLLLRMMVSAVKSDVGKHRTRVSVKNGVSLVCKVLHTEVSVRLSRFASAKSAPSKAVAVFGSILLGRFATLGRPN